MKNDLKSSTLLKKNPEEVRFEDDLAAARQQASTEFSLWRLRRYPPKASVKAQDQSVGSDGEQRSK